LASVNACEPKSIFPFKPILCQRWWTSEHHRRCGHVTEQALEFDIRGVAARARVSIATVSRIMNHVPSVDPLLAARVWKAVADLNYLPNIQARALVSGKSKLLGLIVSEITNPFFPELIQEFEQVAVERGYEILIGSTNYEKIKMETCARRMLERKVDGVAIMTFGFEDFLLDRFASDNIPVVFIDPAPSRPLSSVLAVDYRAGIYEGVQHLAVLGHRKMGFISGPLRLRSAEARRAAFLDCLRCTGIPSNQSWVIEADHTLDGGRDAMQKLLSLTAWPTAIMCSNDMTAIGVQHALFEASLKVPEDFSLIGFEVPIGVQRGWESIFLEAVFIIFPGFATLQNACTPRFHSSHHSTRARFAICTRAVSIIDASASGRSSLSANVRPSAGVTPSVEKKFHEHQPAMIFSGSGPPAAETLYCSQASTSAISAAPFASRENWPRRLVNKKSCSACCAHTLLPVGPGRETAADLAAPPALPQRSSTHLRQCPVPVPRRPRLLTHQPAIAKGAQRRRPRLACAHAGSDVFRHLSLRCDDQALPLADRQHDRDPTTSSPASSFSASTPYVFSFEDNPRHSERSARIGSTREARLAGTRHATTAVSSRQPTIPAMTSGS
jgi:DNA-binding LacI/PurR family transcriptional regulator